MEGVMEPFKDSCDHCGTLVKKEHWTFDLEQCVVCENIECKKKQNAILRAAMDKIVDGLFKGMIKNDQ